MQARSHARVRLGTHQIAVPAEFVLAALPAGAKLTAIPRRGTPAIAACQTARGLVPVVDLARWLDLGRPETGGGGILLLQEGARRVAVHVDALHGVARALAHERLAHDDDPDQLFQSAVRWADGSPPSALLDVRRLADLAQSWAEPCTAQSDVGSAPAVGASARPTAHAVLAAAGTFWGIPATQLVKVIPALPLEYALPDGGATRGFCAWQGSKLPVVDLSLLHGGPATAGAWMAIVADGDRAAALPVDAARQLLPMVPAAGESPAPVLVPRVGQVQPIDAAALLRRLPEAGLAGPLSRLAAARVPAVDAGARIGVCYVLFEQDATYATPAERVLQVVGLDEGQARSVSAGIPVHLKWRGRTVPVHALPCYGAAAAKPGLPRVALLVDVPGGHAPLALAVAGLRGWETAGRVAGVRVPTLGDLGMLTVGEGPARRSHMVVDLAEVACALA
jgi:chemotaxis signal transduction protein